MGCCPGQLYLGPQSFVIPDQELAINDLERSHPFAEIPAGDLFSVFTRFSCMMSKEDFARSCRSLRISPKVFEGPPYCYFVRSVTDSIGRIDVRRLLISSILLSKGHWESKIVLLVAAVEPNKVNFSTFKVSVILEELLYSATTVLTSMAVDSMASQAMDSYLSRLNSVKTALIDKILYRLRDKTEINVHVLINLLNERHEIRKICWGNGIRILLIEEDIRSIERIKKVKRKTHSSISSDLTRKSLLASSGQIKIE